MPFPMKCPEEANLCRQEDYQWLPEAGAGNGDYLLMNPRGLIGVMKLYLILKLNYGDGCTTGKNL